MHDIFVDLFCGNKSSSQKKIIHQYAPDCIYHFKIFRRNIYPGTPSIAVADIIILYESRHFLFRILSKYKPKRFNCSMFSQISPGAIKVPHRKRTCSYIIFFYIKISYFLRIFPRHNLSKIYTKTHENLSTCVTRQGKALTTDPLVMRHGRGLTGKLKGVGIDGVVLVGLLGGKVVLGER